MDKIENIKKITATTYAAFLRGINNIGSKTVKMDELKKIFETIGFKNVRSILASGNIIFETTISNTHIIVAKIEKQLAKKLGYEVKAVVRTADELYSLVKSNPFTKIKLTPQTKLLLTFLSEKPTSRLNPPYESPDKDFIILKITGNEIYSVVKLLPNKRPYRIIIFLEKEFGNKITNRSWTTFFKTVNAIR
ncbi:MAG: DUF1697 domain-containing protein [Bacteroidetes bacterium]|nr:DUF1697 domain-containing protein [Bacteroidota bacterium]